MADLISPSLDRQTARGLTDRLKLPLVVAPMFKVSTPELVVASCRAGAIGSFPSINARTPGLFDDWMTRIAGELDAARADRTSTRLNSSHSCASRMPSSA